MGVLSGDPIARWGQLEALCAAAGQRTGYRGPRSDDALDDQLLADAEMDGDIVWFDPAVDPMPISSGALFAGGVGVAGLRYGQDAYSYGSSGIGSLSGLASPSASSPILALIPDSGRDDSKDDATSTLVARLSGVGTTPDLRGGVGPGPAARG